MKNISNLKPLLVVDVGTDSTKYSQCNLNTYMVSNVLRSKLNEKNISKTSQGNILLNSILNKHEETPVNNTIECEHTTDRADISTLNNELYNINPNTIFDFDYFVKSFPTIFSIISSSTANESYNQLINKYTYSNIKEFVSILDNKFQSDYLNISYLWEFSGDKANFSMDSTKFPFESFYSGLIYDYDTWRKTLDIIGQSLNNNFVSSLFVETPVCITQNSLKFDFLQKQVHEQYQILFEEYKCPFVLICSQGLLNLYSNNSSSGIIVDIGESGTSITTVIDGFTRYESCLYLPFFSGRNITALTALSLKPYSEDSNDKYVKIVDNIEDTNKKSSKLNNSQTFNLDNNNLTYENYLTTKFIKESNSYHVFDYQANYENTISYIYDTKLNFLEASMIPYLLFYPEIFKSILSHRNISNIVEGLGYKHNNSYNNIKVSDLNFKNVFEFIAGGPLKNYNYSNISHNSNFYEKPRFGNYLQNVFIDECINPYKKTEGIEKEALLGDESLYKLSSLKNFRQLSLSHLLFTHIQKLIKNDPKNYHKYLNIYFTGGVLRTPGLKQLIQNDISSLINTKYFNINFPSGDPAKSFYKGVNYLSKLPNLENIMISRQDYFDYGPEYISYNYI